jgi:hypothetical protein
VKNDTDTPDVTFFIILLFEDFRGYIIRGAESLIHLFIFVENFGEAKIDYFQIPVILLFQH